MKPVAKAYMAVSSAIFFWGISFVATKVALQTLPPYILLLGRFSVGTSVLFPLWRLVSPVRVDPKDLLKLGLLGIMEPGLYFIFETKGLSMTSASMASLIIASIPAFAMLGAAVFLKEKTGRWGIFGVTLTMVGVAMLMGHRHGEATAQPQAFIGSFYILGAALCASAYTLLSRSLSIRYNALTITTLQALFATLFFLPPSVAQWHVGLVRALTPEAVIAVLFLALLATCAAFFFYNFALGILPTTKVAVFINVIPLVTVLAARVVLKERQNQGELLAGLVILAGVQITTLDQSGLLYRNGRGWKKLGIRIRSLGRGLHGPAASSLSQKNVEGAGSPVTTAGIGEGENHLSQR